jgi:hypothetical protein
MRSWSRRRKRRLNRKRTFWTFSETNLLDVDMLLQAVCLRRVRQSSHTEAVDPVTACRVGLEDTSRGQLQLMKPGMLERRPS